WAGGGSAVVRRLAWHRPPHRAATAGHSLASRRAHGADRLGRDGNPAVWSIPSGGIGHLGRGAGAVEHAGRRVVSLFRPALPAHWFGRSRCRGNPGRSNG